MLEKKKLLMGAVAGVAIATAYTAPADAKITLMAEEPSGWSFSVDGNVNAFYVYSTGKNANMASGQTARTTTDDTTRIQTGLLPAKFGFGVQGPASNGVQLRGYFALYPQIQNGSTKTARGAQVDMREIYSAATGDFGEVLFGRTLSLFQRNAIVQDMTLFGVGATADNVGNGGTTLGRIGFGYVYPDFNASFRYTTPSYSGTTLSVGIYDASKLKTSTGAGAEGTMTADGADLPRIEGELNISLSGLSEGSNLAISGMYQEAAHKVSANEGGEELEAKGIHVGGTLVGGPVALTAHYFNGECLGITLQMDSGAMSADGVCRDHDGYYIQGTYNYGAGKMGISYGGNFQDKAGNDGALYDPKDSQTMFTAGIYHNLAPEWLGVIEYSHAEEDWHNMETADEDGESDIFSVGMFYLW
jgi:hypothetical protein